MLRKSLQFALLIFSLASCTSTEPKIEDADNPNKNEQDAAPLRALMNSIADKPQTFRISGKKPSTITGERGTKMSINPQFLILENGKEITGEIDVELIEIIDEYSFVLNNAQTVSNGKLLVSGGAYYINMSSSGTKVKIKSKGGVAVEFPKITDKEMSFFTGKRDSLNQMNWTMGKEQFTIKSNQKVEETKYYKTESDELDAIMDYVEGDSTATAKTKRVEVSKEEYQKYLKEKSDRDIAANTYKAIDLLDFGWINCDRFWDDNSPKYTIKLKVQDSINNAQFYLVFNDIKSIMSFYHTKPYKEVKFENIPQGKKAKIIGFTVQNGKHYKFEQSVSAIDDNTIDVRFDETTKEDLVKSIKTL